MISRSDLQYHGTIMCMCLWLTGSDCSSMCQITWKGCIQKITFLFTFHSFQWKLSSRACIICTGVLCDVHKRQSGAHFLQTQAFKSQLVTSTADFNWELREFYFIFSLGQIWVFSWKTCMWHLMLLAVTLYLSLGMWKNSSQVKKGQGGEQQPGEEEEGNEISDTLQPVFLLFEEHFPLGKGTLRVCFFSSHLRGTSHRA